ncbi:hypothetical protein MUGA111182_14450 [Mucilaginibacter galii]|uniref:DUF3592 domain-containing protein n=1 Tax=Mucilaginibacter galii TaxID=2005073 RepID=A0A917J5I3_9SPHI|nr:hypothetical protein [Mucilaginibacter galii]GGI49570.1 hypothetical protein GCM10011425_07820 [Mucilaginibacter galii]
MMSPLRIVALILIALTAVYFAYRRIESRQKLIPVSATVSNSAKAVDDHHTLSIRIQTNEYRRPIRLSYVLFSSKIEERMQVKEGERITFYISPKGTVDLNNHNLPDYKHSILRIPDIRIQAIRGGATWRSFDPDYELKIDLVTILLYTFFAALLPLMKKDNTSANRPFTICFIAFFGLMIVVYLMERLY